MPTEGERERPGPPRLLTAQTRILFTLTVVVGVLSGLAAVAFHRSIDAINDHVLAPILAQAVGTRILGLLVLLPSTGLLVGLCLWRLVPFARGSGIPEVKTAYQFGPGPQLSFLTAAGKFVLGAVSIGCGFSLGREGPTVQICAALGAAVAKFTKRPARMTRTLISVGAAAGIAAAFNTPIAAITFAMEEVIGDLQQRLVGAIVVAAVAAPSSNERSLAAGPCLSSRATAWAPGGSSSSTRCWALSAGLARRSLSKAFSSCAGSSRPGVALRSGPSRRSAVWPWPSSGWSGPRRSESAIR